MHKYTQIGEHCFYIHSKDSKILLGVGILKQCYVCVCSSGPYTHCAVSLHRWGELHCSFPAELSTTLGSKSTAQSQDELIWN